jgi:hypothetical protein
MTHFFPGNLKKNLKIEGTTHKNSQKQHQKNVRKANFENNSS